MAAAIAGTGLGPPAALAQAPDFEVLADGRLVFARLHGGGSRSDLYVTDFRAPR